MFNKYQKTIESLNEKILSCPNYQIDGECYTNLTNVSNFKYKHGPHITYIGSKYGEFEPRILFTRLNWPWYPNVGPFGNLESVSQFRDENPECAIADIHYAYLVGWRSKKGKVYRGIREAGTVTGYPNTPGLTEEELAERRNEPLYGIQYIIEKMVEKGIFPKSQSSLDFCAMNDVIKCSGKLERYHPTKDMEKNCLNEEEFYVKELEILEPQILVAMHSSTHKLIRKKFKPKFNNEDGLYYLYFKNRPVLYWEIPHTRGVVWWNGEKSLPSKHLDLRDNPFHQKITKKEELKFDKKEILFNYVLRLVWVIKQYYCE